MNSFPGDADPDPLGHSDSNGESGSEPSNAAPSGDLAVPARSGGRRASNRGGAALASFLEHAEKGAAPQLLAGPSAWNYASHAAMAICLLGFGWAAGSYLFGSGGPMAGLKPTPAETASPESLERAQIIRSTQKLDDDVRALKANVEAMRAAFAQGPSAKDQHILEKGLDNLKTRLDTVKAETSASISDLAAKVDRLQRDPATKLQQVIDRLDRIEHQSAAPTPASPPAGPAAKGLTPTRIQADATQPKAPPQAERPEPKRLPLITSWVVRDVYDGLAVVENARGSLEVALGENIPGAGTVKSIERRGAGWVVITSRGLIDFVHDGFTP